jgi:hypothetical protein
MQRADRAGEARSSGIALRQSVERRDQLRHHSRETGLEAVECRSI